MANPERKRTLDRFLQLDEVLCSGRGCHTQVYISNEVSMSIKSEAIAWVKDYFAKNGNSETKAVIGISGGKDSSTVAALCCAALGKDRVIGVMMPNGVQSDIEDSKKLCAFLGIKNYTVNIEDAYRGLTCELKKSLGVGVTPAQYNTNTPARLRMATLYSVAALEGNCRVSNNGNLSERLAGYFTLWGDGAGDFAPLANLYVSEVVKLGLALGLPEEVKPLCVIPVGYPAGNDKPKDKWKPENIHYDKW